MLTAILNALLTGPYQLIAGLAAAGAAASVWGRRRSWLDRVAVALFVGYGLLAAGAAVAPDRGTRGASGCDFSSWLPPEPSAWLTASPTMLLLWLFLPLGALSVLPDTARRATTMAIAFAAPVAVELLQALVPVVGHPCSSRDLVVSEMGVMAGYFVGALLLLLTWPLRGSAGRRTRDNDDEDLESFFA